MKYLMQFVLILFVFLLGQYGFCINENNDWAIHIVRKGDCLSKISVKYYHANKFCEEIAKYYKNNIKDINLIITGKTIYLPNIKEVEKEKSLLKEIKNTKIQNENEEYIKLLEDPVITSLIESQNYLLWRKGLSNDVYVPTLDEIKKFPVTKTKLIVNIDGERKEISSAELHKYFRIEKK